MSKIHYFYKITNLINNHFYYGIHSTDNIEDGYMGSGTRLHRAYKKYGIENFQKEILKYFDTREELAQYELEIVNEQLISDQTCYNVVLGGDKYNTLHTVSCIDENGNRKRVYKDIFYDKKYKTFTSGKHTVYDSQLNKNILVDVSINLPSCNKNKMQFKDKNGLFHYTTYNDENVKNGNYVHFSKNMILAKDKNENAFLVYKDDKRFKSGELINFWKNRHHNNETKQKMHETHVKNHHQQGEKNSQYGTCWIHNDDKSIKIKKEQLNEYISGGWKCGRVEKDNIHYKRIWVHNNEKNIKTSEKYIQKYLDNGYILGYKTIKGT